MYRGSLVLIAALLVTTCSRAQDSDATGKQLAEKNPIGYFLGVSMGQQLASQGLKKGDFDPDVLAAGIVDSLGDGELSLSREQLQAAQQSLITLLQSRAKEMMAEQEKMAKENLAKGEAWLAENLKAEGVKELSGGLQYKVLKSGKGATPSQTDTVSVHYTGRLINGEVFDSSVERGKPAVFEVGKVIKGWTMSLQKMKEGDKWMLYIPPSLAYGMRGSAGAIGPNEVLVFEVELLKVNPEPEEN